MTTFDDVRLRAIVPDDLSLMYAMQIDPESNRMAVTFPRTREVFDLLWAKILKDEKNLARAIIAGDALVGYISCFPMDGSDHVGYWIDRPCWGRGLASLALRLFLEEVTKRPLVATVATSNVASLRVLRKCGFVVEQTRHSPASERYPECDVAIHVLA